jgi:hypothetical protein
MALFAISATDYRDKGNQDHGSGNRGQTQIEYVRHLYHSTSSVTTGRRASSGAWNNALCVIVSHGA